MDEQVGLILGGYAEGSTAKLFKATNRVTVVATKLELFEFDDAANRVSEYLNVVSDVGEAGGISDKEGQRKMREARTKPRSTEVIGSWRGGEMAKVSSDLE